MDAEDMEYSMKIIVVGNGVVCTHISHISNIFTFKILTLYRSAKQVLLNDLPKIFLLTNIKKL